MTEERRIEVAAFDDDVEGLPEIDISGEENEDWIKHVPGYDDDKLEAVNEGTRNGRGDADTVEAPDDSEQAPGSPS